MVVSVTIGKGETAMSRIIPVLVLAGLALAQPALAQSNTQTISVDVGSYCGYWRLSNTATQEIYQCNTAATGQRQAPPDIGYSHGSCTLSVPNGPVKFELFALKGRMNLEIGNSPIISAPTPDSMNTMIEVDDDGKTGTIIMNLATVHFEENGYEGRYAIEQYLADPQTPGACIGGNVELPFSSKFNLVVGAAQLFQLEVNEQGHVTSSSPDSLINVDHDTIGFKTVAALVAPEVYAMWLIHGVTDWLSKPPGGYFEGPYMVRLLQGARYTLWSESQSGDRGVAYFNTRSTCTADSRSIFVPKVGYFQVSEQCGSELP